MQLTVDDPLFLLAVAVIVAVFEPVGQVKLQTTAMDGVVSSLTATQASLVLHVTVVGVVPSLNFAFNTTS